ncbi:MAG: DUF4126 domain-containing protein [Phycisphaerales bacterium]|nr:MAG: DUF4126 domain-containing protein [Phycisphaerales bacterium]
MPGLHELTASIVAICVGLGLAAACGFRVFVPLALAGLGAKLGLIHVGDSFAWLSSWPALIALAVACVLEVGAYYIPWVDHALDAVATPAAAVAGAVLAASQVTGLVADSTPLTQFAGWATALIAGGAVAGTIQGTTVATRSVSTISTGGLANPIVSTLENALSAVLAVLAVVVPIAIGVLLLLVLAWFITRRVRKAKQARLAAILVPM